MLADYHVHSEFSDDSTEPMEQVVQAAIAAGLDELCFTDHVDYGVKVDHDVYRRFSPAERERVGTSLNVDYPAYFARIAQLREAYRKQIVIRQGLEFGVQTHTISAYQALNDGYVLDFVILSCHQIEDREFWTRDFQRDKTPAEFNTRYYQELYDCVLAYKGYSVLGHLDVIQRYSDEIHPFAASQDMIANILRQVIRDGKGIEVNTSSFRYGLSDLTPERAILQLYRELGGTVVTIGSDCHRAKDVGERIAHVQGELKAMGFAGFCTFERMRPIFHAFE